MTINTYGEALFEAAILLLTLPIVAWYAYTLAKGTNSCMSVYCLKENMMLEKNLKITRTRRVLRGLRARRCTW